METFDYNTRRAVTDRRKEELNRRIRKISGQDRELALELAGQSGSNGEKVGQIVRTFYEEKKTPSQWFKKRGILPGSRVHKGLLDAFLVLLQVIEDHDLIRYSSVKRAVSTWIGIFDEKSVDRVNGKLLHLMGQCLRDRTFCREQLRTNDSIAISAALWALGFEEAETAIQAMTELIDHGMKNQKLTASFYNQNLFHDTYKIRTAQKVVLEYTDDLELVAAFMPAFTGRLGGWIRGLLYKDRTSPVKVAEPSRPVLTDYFEDRGGCPAAI